MSAVPSLSSEPTALSLSSEPTPPTTHIGDRCFRVRSVPRCTTDWRATWRAIRDGRSCHLPYVPPPPLITARPGACADAPEWTRWGTALERWIEGRASVTEVGAAIAHGYSATRDVRRPWPSPREKRDRPERNKTPPPPPTFTRDELTTAAAILEARCKGPLLECAWLELKNPPPRCKLAADLATRVDRAIERARRRRLGDDACARKRRVSFGSPATNDGEPSLRLGGRTPRTKSPW